MTTLTVRVDEKTRREYKLTQKELTFSELRRRIIARAAQSSLPDYEKEAKHRKGYKKKPVLKNEFTVWEAEQVWVD
jgi:hypothetical protein